MHYWRLLLLAFLASLVPIAQADRLLVYGDRRLLQEQERFYGKEARDTRTTLDGVRTQPSLKREQFDARTVNSRDTRRTLAERRSLDRDNQRLTLIRSAEDRISLNKQFTRKRSTEKARDLRSVSDITRREFPEQRFSRDVRQNSLERLQSQVRSDRYSTGETKRLIESRSSREINDNRDNYMKRSTRAQQSRREKLFTNPQSRFEMSRFERENINEQRDNELNIRSERNTQRITSRSRRDDGRLFTNSRSKSSEMSRRERDNINAQRDRVLNVRQTSRDADRLSSRTRQNDNRLFSNLKSRSSEMTLRKRENTIDQRDREGTIRQSDRVTERMSSRLRQNDDRFITNSRARSSVTIRRERENMNNQLERERTIRQSNRDRQMFARSRQSVNRIESRENSPRDRNNENRRIRDENGLSIRRVNNFDGERISRFAQEKTFVRNDIRISDAPVRQERLMRTNERDNERNIEDRRVRSAEREDFRQMDRRTATGLLSDRVEFGNWQHRNQKNVIQTQTTSLLYFFYTLQGLYICSVLLNLAGLYKSEKNNCGFLQFLISPAGKDIKVD